MISVVIAVLAAIVSIPVFVFSIEAIAAFLPFPKRGRPSMAFDAPRRLALVMPAHNEGSGLVPTIDDVKPQLKEGDRLIVVADNCSDNTADVAEKAGADVISRHDTNRIGKGYALAYAIEHLREDPPD